MEGREARKEKKTKEERRRDGVFNLLSTGEQGEKGEEERAGWSEEEESL